MNEFNAKPYYEIHGLALNYQVCVKPKHHYHSE